MSRTTEVRCICLTCGHHAHRTWRVDSVDHGGYGLCRRLRNGTVCGGTLKPKATVMQERKAARAKAEIAELENGGRA